MKKRSLKNEMKCSYSSTWVPNVARLVGLRSWKGSFKKKPHIAVNVSKRELNTHRAFTVGVRLECMRIRKPKRCGVRGKRPIRRKKREKTFQKDHHRLHTDRHGLPSDRLCYSETMEVGDEEGMEK